MSEATQSVTPVSNSQSRLENHPERSKDLQYHPAYFTEGDAAVWRLVNVVSECCGKRPGDGVQVLQLYPHAGPVTRESLPHTPTCPRPATFCVMLEYPTSQGLGTAAVWSRSSQRTHLDPATPASPSP